MMMVGVAVIVVAVIGEFILKKAGVAICWSCVAVVPVLVLVYYQ